MKNIIFISYCSYPWKQASIVGDEYKRYRPISAIGDLGENVIGRYRDFSLIGDEGIVVKYRQNRDYVGAVG